MLSGEGKENDEKATIGLTLFVHFFAVVLHDYNLKLPETSWLPVLWRKYRTFSYSFFFSPLCSPWCPLVFLIFPPPLQNSHVVLPTKKCLLCLLSLALAVCRSFSRWTSLACRPHSLFLCLSLALYSKSVDMTNNLSLIYRFSQG